MPKHMDSFSWLQLAIICFLGAVSPGPSLALVISNTLAGGRTNGISTSIGHAVGIGWWAILTAIGVAELVVNQAMLLSGLQLVGSVVLAYIGIRTMLAKAYLSNRPEEDRSKRSLLVLKGASQGLLISLFNPKIALFFLAIFSHLVGDNPTWIEIGIMGLITAVTDGLWYVFVALMVTTAGFGNLVRAKQNVIALVSGVILMAIALYLLGATLRSL